MRNIIVFYLAILLPLPLLIILAFSDQTTLFTILLLVYALPYRTAIDGARLVNKKLINWKEVWKLLIPGKRIDFFRELYIKK